MGAPRSTRRENNTPQTVNFGSEIDGEHTRVRWQEKRGRAMRKNNTTEIEQNEIPCASAFLGLRWVPGGGRGGLIQRK